MAIEITIPRLGWSMDEGMFGEWLKQNGERVEPGEPLFTLEGDKALQDVESVDAGILHVLPDGPQGGDTVQVGMLVGFLLAEGEEPPDQSQLESTKKVTAPPAEAASTSDRPAMPSTVEVSYAPTSPGSDAGLAITPPVGPIPHRNSDRDLPSISPRAARIAQDLGVDWTQISGSGRTGRIREQDVRAMAAQLGSQPSASTGSLRRTIARRMLEIARTTVPVTLTTRADAAQLVAIRRQWKNSSTDGLVPTYQDMIAKLVATALLDHPVMNSRWQNEQLVASDAIHIGIAVDSEAGLLVPVIRNVDRLSIWDVGTTSKNLIERARSRTCSKEELTGSTFTITNLGAFGIDAFTPVINAPEVAILGLGAIRREAVVGENDQILSRDQISLSLTFNHLAVDGAPAARFLQRIVTLIETLKSDYFN